MEQKPYHLCFETFSNELRIKILNALQEKPMSVNELAEKTGVERSNVSHSLQMLRLCRLVDVRKSGKNMIYSIKDKSLLNGVPSQGANTLFKVIDTHVDHFCKTCAKTNEGELK